MISRHRGFRQTLFMTLGVMVLLSGCHHKSSGASATASNFVVVVAVAGLAGTGLVLQDNGASNLSVTANGQTNFATTIVSGRTYSVTVLTQPASPAQVCSVSGGTGTIQTSNVLVLVSCGTVGTAVGRFAYVTNRGSSSISAYAINASSGALTPVAGSPFAVTGAVALTQALVDPTGSYLYAVDMLGNQLFAAQINQSTGALVPVSGSPFPTGKMPVSLAFDYSGSYLYVANYTDNTLSAYLVSIATGALTQVSGSPFVVPGTNPGPRQISRAGDYLFVANSTSGTVAVFAITAGTGALTQSVSGSPFATDAGPHGLAIDPTGKLLYTANAGTGGAGSISAFTLDLSNGVLTPVAGNPLAIPVVNNIGIDAQSKYLFVTEQAGIAVYPIVNTATGLLGSPVGGSPFTAGTNPYALTTDVADQFVYVGNDGSANVSQYTFSVATGMLTPVVGAPAVAAGTNPDYVQIQ